MSDCEATAASCLCSLDDGHKEPHTCICGGQFTGTGDDFEAVTLPQPDRIWPGYIGKAKRKSEITDA